MFAPPVGLAAGPLGVVQAGDREGARRLAVEARALAAFAAARPASADRAQGEPGAMSVQRWTARPEVLRGVSEWAVPELVVALSISEVAAQARLVRALTLVSRLPGTLAALEAGALHAGHVGPLVDLVAPIEDDPVRAQVEAGLLRWMAGRVVTPAQLGAKARREVARCDARAAARRLARALQQRGVSVRPDGPDGMASVTVWLTVPEARALHRVLEACADALPVDPSDRRSRGQKMADCLLDLVLRPGESDLPPVQVLLDVVASVGTLAGGDEPGEVDGHPVPAEMVRRLLAALEPVGDQLPGSAPQPTDRADDTTSAPATVPAPATASAPATTPESDPVTATRATAPSGPVPSCPSGGPQSAARGWQDAEQEELSDWLDDPPDWRVPDHPPADWTDTDPAHRATDGRGGGPGSASDSSWWATADRAVDEAGIAVRRAGQAVVRAAGLVDAAVAADTADEAAWRAGPGRSTGAADALAVLRLCTGDQKAWLVALLDATGGGGLAERPRILLTDALTGALLALSDLPGLRRAARCGAPACRRPATRCTHELTGRPGLGPPPPSPGYRPGAALDRFVRARDRRCRFPGCRRPVPRGGELDHHRPHPLGDTSATNLTGYCTGHHRGKHQALGWRHELALDGTVTVTTPTGLVASTEPPPY